LYNDDIVKKRKKDFRKPITGGVMILVLLIAISFICIFPNQLRSTLSVIKNAGIQLASVILSHNFRSIAEIKSKYEDPQRKVRVLIVPGHEPNYGGSVYGDLLERDMNVELGQNLQKFLESNPHYQVFIARDTNSWSPEISNYYKNNWDDIVEWTAASREEFSRLVSIGSTTRTFSTVTHNDAAREVALRLYGLTKWSNENNIDIAIHIHFNDNRRSDTSRPGKYSGFSMYVPAAQYGNSTTTKVIADSIMKRLAKYNTVSDLPGESSGIIDEPELIAVGSNNTADAASILIEYSYMYEPQLQDSQVRSMAIKDLAFQTYLGLQDFFDSSGNANLARAYDTTILPYKWNTPQVDNKASASDIFALQTALTFKGVYPPTNRTKNDCPRTGAIGNCTRTSLEVFQNKYGVSGETGVAGQRTLELLNQI
jgi:N-acetylmuramoyl-L-alanine amidase